MAKDQWFIRDVDEATKKKIKMYALEHETTIAGALKQLINLALAQQKK